MEDKVFAEGVIFYNLRRKSEGKSYMAKLRRNMFDWYYSDKVEIFDYVPEGKDESIIGYIFSKNVIDVLNFNFSFNIKKLLLSKGIRMEENSTKEEKKFGVKQLIVVIIIATVVATMVLEVFIFSPS